MTPEETTPDIKEIRRRSEDLRPTIGAIVLFVLAVLLVCAGTAYSVYTDNVNKRAIIANQQANNQAWCDALNLLTSRPISPPRDPSANPSREGQYRLYVDFVNLKERFGCRLWRNWSAKSFAMSRGVSMPSTR